MLKRNSSEIEQALNASFSNREELYDNPPNFWDIVRGRPFSDEEKRGGKILTYKEICCYMKSVQIRDENHTTELLNLRYENEALKVQVRQYRRNTQNMRDLRTPQFSKMTTSMILQTRLWETDHMR